MCTQFVQVTDGHVQKTNNTALGLTRYPVWFRLHPRLNAITAPNTNFFESLKVHCSSRRFRFTYTFTFNGHRTYLPWISRSLFSLLAPTSPFQLNSALLNCYHWKSEGDSPNGLQDRLKCKTRHRNCLRPAAGTVTENFIGVGETSWHFAFSPQNLRAQCTTVLSVTKSFQGTLNAYS